jgi:hypothetical protein
MNLQHEHDIEELEAQLRAYKEERERIRDLLGRIGGKTDVKQDKVANWIFFILILLLFAFDLVRYVLNIHIPLPPLVSIEIGILLVSVKIIWMISRQTKVNHFQFWILNSIEFRINNLSQQVSDLQQAMENVKEETQPEK